jgi:hypothetical protein
MCVAQSKWPIGLGGDSRGGNKYEVRLDTVHLRAGTSRCHHPQLEDFMRSIP